MSKPEFVYVIYIASTPEKVFEALTDTEASRHYWHGNFVESDWKVGSPFALRLVRHEKDEGGSSQDATEHQSPPGANLRWLSFNASTTVWTRQRHHLDMQPFGCLLSPPWMKSSKRSPMRRDGRCWTGFTPGTAKP